jgi:hypothetical protein
MVEWYCDYNQYFDLPGIPGKDGIPKALFVWRHSDGSGRRSQSGNSHAEHLGLPRSHRPCILKDMAALHASKYTVSLLNFRNLSDVYFGLSKVCLSVCMSEVVFCSSFLNGFVWNFGNKFKILFSLIGQIYEKCEHFYVFYYSRIISLFDLFRCVILSFYHIACQIWGNSDN